MYAYTCYMYVYTYFMYMYVYMYLHSESMNRKPIINNLMVSLFYPSFQPQGDH